MSIAATANEARCGWTRRITYSMHDTPLTVEQIKIHNKSGRTIRCWK